jgi:hypothetical protein
MKRIAMAAACLAFLGAATDTLSQADRSAAFTAAGFKRTGQQWKACDDSSPSATPGTVDQVADLNGDGRPEVLLSETSTNCYGSTESGYFLVSKQADGRWKLIASGPGVVTVLAVKGAGGWPDLEIGGPGFCFPVQRWNGAEYRVVRYQYEGKSCRP